MTVEAAYWRQRKPATVELPEHARFVGLLRRVLPSLGPIGSVLDVGAGRGRLGLVIADLLSDASYTAVDVNAGALKQLRKTLPHAKTYRCPIQAFANPEPYDLVLASEVLMHIPPDDIAAVVGKLQRLASVALVTVDWTEPVADERSRWNWRHDYDAFALVPYSRIGAQTMHVWQP